MRKLFEISKSRASLDSSSELPVVSVSDNEDHPEELKAVSVEVVELDVASRIACYTHPYGQGADRFRLLKMRLRESWAPGKPKILLVTSPLPEDGKSTVALNLTAALAEGPRPTLLLEADLRRGSLTQRLGIRPGSGVAECLESGVSPLSVMRRIVPLNFYAMTAGTTKGNPTELLQSPNFGELLRYLGAHFEWIVIDSPPVVVLSDAIALLRHAGAALMVVRQGQTPADAIDQAVALIGKNSLFGLVLNGADDLPKSTYKQYYNYKRNANGSKG